MRCGHLGGWLKLAKSTTAPRCSGKGAMKSAKTAQIKMMPIRISPSSDSGFEARIATARLMSVLARSGCAG